MDSKLEKITIVDSNTIANEILNGVIDEKKVDLNSDDLFKLDCNVLSSIKNTSDFSTDLLVKLENGKFEEITEIPPKDFVKDIQQEAVLDILFPIQEMFDYVSNIIVENLSEV